MAAALQIEQGPRVEDRPWQPCPACGIPDAVMRDPETKRPRSPAPLVAEGVECLMCIDLADKAKELGEQFGEKGQLPPGIRVVPVPFKPPSET